MPHQCTSKNSPTAPPAADGLMFGISVCRSVPIAAGGWSVSGRPERHRPCPAWPARWHPWRSASPTFWAANCWAASSRRRCRRSNAGSVPSSQKWQRFDFGACGLPMGETEHPGAVHNNTRSRARPCKCPGAIQTKKAAPKQDAAFFSLSRAAVGLTAAARSAA